MNILLKGKTGTLLSRGALKILALLQRMRLKPSRLAVITYHQVVSHAGPYLPGEFYVNTFDWHLKLLKKYFNILPLSTAIELLQRNALPPLALAITFDDGYRNNFTEAVPVLYKYKIPATIFIASNFIGDGIMWNDTVNECVRSAPLMRLDLSDVGLASYPLHDADDRLKAITDIKEKLKYTNPEHREEAVAAIKQRCGVKLDQGIMMDSNQLASLAKYNIEIGAHTVNHPILNLISDENAMQEIHDSKIALEKLLQSEIHFFAYPNGKPEKDFTGKHMEMAEKSGFMAAFNTCYGAADSVQNRFSLPRISVWGKNAAQFIMHIIRSY